MQHPSFPLPSIKILEDEREGILSILRGLEGAFPDDNEVPAVRRPRLLVLCVAADISTELRVPKRTV